MTEIEKLKSEVVFVCYESGRPEFAQGYGSSQSDCELASPVTAEECANYIQKIKKLRVLLMEMSNLYLQCRDNFGIPYDLDEATLVVNSAARELLSRELL